MPTGISIPIRAVAGRTVIDEGEEQTQKIIMLTLMPDDSENPFVDRGTDARIFDPIGPSWVSFMRQRITSHFERWEREHRAKLQRLNFVQGVAGDEIEVEIHYIDLRSNHESEVTVPIRR